MESRIVEGIIDFNQRVLKIEPRGIGQMVDGEVEATRKALFEEATEFKDSHEQGDILGMIDALLDGIYFGFGALYKMGLNAQQIEECMAAVQACNMEKKLGIVEKRGNPLGDAVKPEGWVGPEERIAAILDRQATEA